jgi:phage shock protein PspC (stress-responsive transcriptional regulator)
MAAILWEHAFMAQVDARQRAPRLERSRRDRWIAGVAGGIAHHLGVQPSIVRIAFVVTSFAAGFGLVVYVLTWLLAPLETLADGIESPPRRIRLPSLGRAIGIGLVIAGILALLWVAGLWFQGTSRGRSCSAPSGLRSSGRVATANAAAGTSRPWGLRCQRHASRSVRS